MELLHPRSRHILAARRALASDARQNNGEVSACGDNPKGKLSPPLSESSTELNENSHRHSGEARE